ncbi:unnamed protein product [Sphagnum jensenii]
MTAARNYVIRAVREAVTKDFLNLHGYASEVREGLNIVEAEAVPACKGQETIRSFELVGPIRQANQLLLEGSVEVVHHQVFMGREDSVSHGCVPNKFGEVSLVLWKTMDKDRYRLLAALNLIGGLSLCGL